MSKPPSRKRRWLLGAGLLAMLAGCLGFWLGRDHVLPESSPYSRGRERAVSAGCTSCHGLELPPAVNPGLGVEPGIQLPRLHDSSADAVVLRQWIDNGQSDARAASGEAAKELLSMPAYRDVLDESAREDLVAHLLLIQRSPEPRGDGLLSRGEQLARQNGCFQCHGPLGQGGVANPGALKGYIPGFFGTDFALLTREGLREDVVEWIRDGAAAAFLAQGLGPIQPARWFTEAQTIKMPDYGRVLSAAEIEQLADYVLELHRRGPLDAAGIEAYRSALAAEQPEPCPDSIDFGRDIAPLLERHCLRCHQAGDARSRYAMDAPGPALDGGQLSKVHGDAAIVAGSSQESRLMWMLEAKKDDYARDVYPMPPDAPMPAAEIDCIRRWIDEGAPWPEEIILRAVDGTEGGSR